jgi:hypothetical protein
MGATAIDASVSTAREELTRFLVDRLTEEVEQLWVRELERPGGPDWVRLSAHTGLIEEQLGQLRLGRLPTPSQLGVLLIAFGDHPELDETWIERFVRRRRRRG